jgi:hypothetical protein
MKILEVGAEAGGGFAAEGELPAEPFDVAGAAHDARLAQAARLWSRRRSKELRPPHTPWRMFQRTA